MAMAERIFRDKFSVPFGAADTSNTVSFVREGELNGLFVRVPNFTNAVTATVSILDSDGYEFVVSSPLAKNADHRLNVAWPLPGAQTLKVALSGAPGGSGGTVVVVGYGRRLGG